VANHDRDFVARQLFGDRAGLFWIAGVVADIGLQLLAEHAARGVDRRDRGIHAVLELRSERRVLTGHRSRDADGDILGRCGRRQSNRGTERQAEQTKMFHSLLLAA
jgi:hypothetical protein